MATQPYQFSAPYLEVDTIWFDVETTGLLPGIDQVCQVGLARFEHGACVASCGSLIDPLMVIPDEAVAIHGITTDMVEDAPSLRDFFERPDVLRMLAGCQPGAYNAPFDRCFAPAWVWDHSWPWLDALVAVRIVDRFTKGAGRHKLPAVCERHGITSHNAHNAESDACVAGAVFYKLMPQAIKQAGYPAHTLGEALLYTRIEEANAWHSFHSWLAKQPAKESP